MAVEARYIHYDGFFSLALLVENQGNAMVDYPDDRDWPIGFDYDIDKLDAGEREFLGIEVLDVTRITDYWLAELAKLDLPRVNLPEAGLTNATIADVLRWARSTFPSRYSRATA